MSVPLGASNESSTVIQQVFEPGTVLGVLGGGQLGAMFTNAARRMGYRVAVWDPDADAPAHRVAEHSFPASFSDTAVRDRFTAIAQAVTVEWENVPANLCEWLEQRRRMSPSSAVLRVIQDRITQKEYLASHQLPVPAFISIDSPRGLIKGVERLGFPLVCKTATTGYDGKGQWIVRDYAAIGQIEDAMSAAHPGQRWILEQWIRFERELSVLVVRDDHDTYRVYPVVENRHEQGILRTTQVPAVIHHTVAEQATTLSVQAVRALKGVGVFCVELFQTSDHRLLINEIAPRPHNSGHYTLDVCTVSQFEQQVRVTSGLPLGEVRLMSPAVMVNLIGEEVRTVLSIEGCTQLHSTPGALLHLYGKRVIRPGRKMGNVTFTADQAERTTDLADRFMKGLSMHT